MVCFVPQLNTKCIKMAATVWVYINEGWCFLIVGGNIVRVII